MAVFYDAADWSSVGASLGSNVERYYNYVSPSGSTIKGHLGGSINGPSGTAYGVYIDPAYFVALNNLIGAGQNGNVTDTIRQAEIRYGAPARACKMG